MGKKILLSGNEAIARGAYEANVWVATGYPGTPSSEIIENVAAQYKDINSEWSVNEKVALETALGSSFAGVRTLCTMKHVGLNVAADPLMTATYTGVNSGLVIAVADDPSMHSSQNEQDTRNYAEFGKFPLLEPSDSQEAKDFVGLGMEISEKFDAPVILRSVTRISHTRTVVELYDQERKIPEPSYQKNYQKYVMIPANSRKRHPEVLERYRKLEDYSNQYPGHEPEYRQKNIGIITHGLIYHHVREAFPEASVLKISMYPVPMKKIKEFAENVDQLYVVEELDPIIERACVSAGISLTETNKLPRFGELTVQRIINAFSEKSDQPEKIEKAQSNLPVRPPVLCPGCGHIPVFEVLRDMNCTVLGDIGCYTLGSLPPYQAMDTTVCMGASIGNEAGFHKAESVLKNNYKAVSVIGDSTFFHSGMTNLLNTVYNRIPVTVLILDNRITAMTGHQSNPGSGLDQAYSPVPRIDIEKLVKGFGIERVKKVNAYKKDILKKAVEEEINSNEVSVLIVEGICVIGQKILNQHGASK